MKLLQPAGARLRIVEPVEFLQVSGTEGPVGGPRDAVDAYARVLARVHREVAAGATSADHALVARLQQAVDALRAGQPAAVDPRLWRDLSKHPAAAGAAFGSAFGDGSQQQ